LELAQASFLLRVKVISSPRRGTYIGLKLPLGLGELDAGLGEFRLRKLYEMTILPFFVALFLNLTNNHQNPQQPLSLALYWCQTP